MSLDGGTAKPILIRVVAMARAAAKAGGARILRAGAYELVYAAPEGLEASVGAALASGVPAWRAARISPVEALRAE